MLSQDSYEVLQKSYELAEENYNIVNAKYQQGAVSEFDKITAEVQMRSVKPSVISAGNAVTLSKLQLKGLMGVPADGEFKLTDIWRPMKASCLPISWRMTLTKVW